MAQWIFMTESTDIFQDTILTLPPRIFQSFLPTNIFQFERIGYSFLRLCSGLFESCYFLDKRGYWWELVDHQEESKP